MKLVLVFLALVAVSFAVIQRFTIDDPQPPTDTCLDGGSCTAKDFENVVVGTVSVSSCLRGSTFQTDLELLYTSKKVERYGLAWFISKTGGIARDVDGVPTLGCNVRTLDEAQSNAPVDDCGDWKYEPVQVSVLHYNVTLLCESAIGGANVLTNICLGWDESANNRLCEGTNLPRNGLFGSKCDCNDFDTGIVIGCNVCLAPPTFSSAAPASLNVQCPADVPAGANKPATDSCGNALTGLVSDSAPVAGSCSSRYSLTRTWTATDSCPTTITQTQQINVLNNRALTVTAPAPQTVNCPADINNAQSATYVDGCGSNGVTTTYSDGAITPGSCPKRYSFVRTWTATDACGNQGSATQVITVANNQALTVTAPGDLIVACPSQIPTSATLSYTDSCGIGGVAATATFVDGTQTSEGCPTRYSFTRTWTVTDECGNQGTTTQLIRVFNNVALTVTAPAAVEVQCEADIPTNQQAAWTGGCSTAGVTTTFTDGARTQNGCATRFSFTRTWTATDLCGNQGSATQQITVLNNRALTVTTPAPQTVNCPADINNAQSATYVDGCGNNGVTTTYSDVVTPGTCPTRYTVTRTWTATDACGNQGSAAQLLTVNNQLPPTVTAPADQTVQCRSEINNSQQATWVDACGVSRGSCSSFENGPASGTCIDRETFTRTFTCSDDCGNSGSDTQLITVNNQEAPSITCQSSGNAASCDPARFVDPTGTGACGDSLTYTTSQSDVVIPTSITRTWIGTDRCGNSATCSTTLTCTTGEFCVFTQGYWKTHSFDSRSGKIDLTWECCDKDFFNCVNLRGSPYHWIDILTTPSRSGPQQLLFISGRQWVAAYLNLERAGKTYLDVANTDFQECYVRLEAIYSSTCSFEEEDRAAIIGCAFILDLFNNGLLGVPHCGSDGFTSTCRSLFEL